MSEHLPNSQSGDFQMQTVAQRRASDADDPEISKSLLQRDRAMRGHSVEQAAKVMKIDPQRLRYLEDPGSFWVCPTEVEAVALRKYTHGVDPETLRLPNTVENRRLVAGRL